MDAATARPPVAQTTTKTTPRTRPAPRHLRQLSLAPSSSSSPSLDGAPLSATSPPTWSPTPPSTPHSASFSRSVSLSRSGRRQSSIGYGPPRSPLSAVPLDRSTGSLDSSSLRSPLSRDSSTGGLIGLGLAVEHLAPPSTPFGPATPGGAAADRERDPLTLTEKYADLLSAIAQKEPQSLELREALAANEAELTKLKSQWTTIVTRASRNASAGSGPPTAASPSRTPPLPSSTPSSAGPASLFSGLGNLGTIAGELLGVSDDSTASTSSSSGSSSSAPPNGISTPTPAPFRTSLEVFTSSARAALGALVEDSSEPVIPSSTPISRSHSARAATTGKRSSILSSTSSASSSSKGNSIDSTSSVASSLFSSPPTDDRAAWDFNEVGSLRRTSSSGGAADPASSRDSRALMDDLAASNSGWGRRFGDLAAGLGGSESLQSTKRATLSITSSLVTSLSSLASPPPTQANHPLTAPPPKSALGLLASPLTARSSSSSRPGLTSPSLSSTTSRPPPKATKMTVLAPSPVKSAASARAQLAAPAPVSLIDFGDDDDDCDRLEARDGILTPPRSSPGPGIRSPARSRTASQSTDDDWNW